MNNILLHDTRSKIVEIGCLLYKRQLTDSAGGNISIKVNDQICISPRRSGSNFQWNITPEQVCVVDIKGNKIEGEGEPSRELAVHLKLHTEFVDFGRAVIHAHPRNILVFASTKTPIVPVLEHSVKFGITPVIDYFPACSQKLADAVTASLKGREDMICNHAAGVIVPGHGLFLMGRDINAAYDAVERLELNAYCILMSKLIESDTANSHTVNN
jgi:L-fuculose-phosphate aldolase